MLSFLFVLVLFCKAQYFAKRHLLRVGCYVRAQTMVLLFLFIGLLFASFSGLYEKLICMRVKRGINIYDCHFQKSNNARIFPTENSSTEWVFFSTRMHCVQYVYHTLTQTQFNHQCQWCSCKIYIFSETLCHFTNSSEKLKSRTHMHRN